MRAADTDITKGDVLKICNLSGADLSLLYNQRHLMLRLVE